MEDTYSENLFVEKKPSPRLKLPGRRTASSLFSSDNHHREIERMRKDIVDKENQIQMFECQVKTFRECCQGLRKLIVDLETASGTTFLNNDQRKNVEKMPHNESVLVLRKALGFLTKEYQTLPATYEKAFETKALNLSASIDKINDQTKQIILQRRQVQKENNVLNRIIEINTKEKKSLQAYAESIQKATNDQIAQSNQTILQTKDSIQKLKHEINNTNTSISNKTMVNTELARTVNAGTSRRHKDMLDNYKNLQDEYSRLLVYYEKEKTEHERTRKELEHTQSEIERAKRTIQKFNQSVSTKTIRYATQVNKDLRNYINEQREEQRMKLQATIKHNKDLERQINEQMEETGMLIPYLQSIEKKLQAEMLKLPSLTDIQRRNDNEPKRALTKLNKREMDDVEMRAVKRTLTRMKVKRARAKTAFGK